MKPKYEKMIDEYVKKHYGDLERGVLAPEVKYKVLWKIYRKKYRIEKNMREHLEKTMKDWCSQNKALSLPEDLDRKLFPWHLAPSPDKVLPKEDGFDHLAEEANNLCNSTSYLDWLHDDITWCARECSNMDCERNSRNRRCKEGLFSAADMFDPFRCPVDAEMPEVKKK